MTPVPSVRPRSALCILLLAVLAGCADAAAKQGPAQDKAATHAEAPPDPYVDHPLYGLVTGTQLVVRKEPDPSGLTLGWLRRGEIVRLKPTAHKTPTCQSGWHELHPRGYACAGEGIAVSETPPQVAEEDRAQARRDAALPYQYYLVKAPKTAEFHQVPSRDQQRATRDYVQAWLAVEAEKSDAKKQKFLEGKLPGQPTKHAVVRRFLDRGFYVAGTGVAVRSQRRFVHTVRGSYVKEQEVEARSGSAFRGVELADTRKLPIAWAVRTSPPQRARTLPDGSVKLVDDPEAKPLERLSVVESWKGWARVEGQLVHELSDGSYVRDWHLAVAEPMERPKEVKADEPWVHIDLGEQTLVLYVGDTPRFATLVSSGLRDHKTPVGSFRIQRKHVSDTMANIGADAADDRYSIEDVPWTQYFEGSLALHAAFWHSQFGLQRSHGCVNLAPADAFYLFQHTWPEVPSGWHGVSAQKTGLTGSLVVITD